MAIPLFSDIDGIDCHTLYTPGGPVLPDVARNAKVQQRNPDADTLLWQRLKRLSVDAEPPPATSLSTTELEPSTTPTVDQSQLPLPPQPKLSAKQRRKQVAKELAKAQEAEKKRLNNQRRRQSDKARKRQKRAEQKDVEGAPGNIRHVQNAQVAAAPPTELHTLPHSKPAYIGLREDMTQYAKCNTYPPEYWIAKGFTLIEHDNS